MTQKYRKELTSNITFQPNKIFVRNDLFEKIIKSCKATNLEFLKLKEKQELISMSEEIFKEEKIITQHDVENKQLKEKNKKVRKEENEKVESRKVKNENVGSRNVESRKEENEKVRKENDN